MKICVLIPCLMLENNRDKNHDAMEYAKSYGADEIIVYDQEFEESDYKEGFTYIGHQAKRRGFVTPRNELLKWFYNSEYDYAFWIDANEKVSATCMNDVETLFNALREGLEVNAIVATMGIQISNERIEAKKRKDLLDFMYLLRSKRGYEWMHGLVIRNFKKYYGKGVYIDERCDPWKGTSEDIYFIRLLRRLFEVQLLPTLVISKPNNKTSTWMKDRKGYSYPPVDLPIIDELIQENIGKYRDMHGVHVPNYIRIPRLKTSSRDKIKRYIPRR